MGFSIVSWRWFIKNVKKPIKQIFPVQYLENKKLWKVESLNTGLERGSLIHDYVCFSCSCIVCFSFCFGFFYFYSFRYLHMQLNINSTEMMLQYFLTI